MRVIVIFLCLIPLQAFSAKHFQSEQAAQQYCPDDTVVWLNVRSGSIHSKGQPWYGRTHVGAYACQKEVARRSGKAIKNNHNDMAGWKRVVEDKDRSVYASLFPVEKNGSRVTILSMVDLRQASSLSDGKPFLSWETQYEFDCKQKQSRIVAASMYSGNMGRGEITNSIEYGSPGWEVVPAGSNGEALWKLACRKR